jgi:hypothetical protein
VLGIQSRTTRQYFYSVMNLVIYFCATISSSDLPRIRKEMDADHFGGCAAGALGATWETVADLIS